MPHMRPTDECLNSESMSQTEGQPNSKSKTKKHMDELHVYGFDIHHQGKESKTS